MLEITLCSGYFGKECSILTTCKIATSRRPLAASSVNKLERGIYQLDLPC